MFEELRWMGDKISIQMSNVEKVHQNKFLIDIFTNNWQVLFAGFPYERSSDQKSKKMRED